MMHGWIGIAVAVLLLPAAAQAEGSRHCGLTQIAALKMAPNGDGAILVPVGLNGHPALLQLDTGGFWSVLHGNVVAGMTQRNEFGVSVTGAGGGSLSRYVSLPQIELDQSVVKHADFFIGPDAPDTQVGGILGANILQAYDVEIDQAHGQVNLYKQDHCKGVVVYWAESDATKVPFDFDNHLMTVEVTLDGKPLRALVDTGAFDSILSLKAAKDLFGLGPDSPDVKAGGSASTVDGKGLRLYRHRFKTLQIGDITFSNPEMMLGEDKLEYINWASLGNHAPDLILGMHQLRMLHLYIAYGEGMLYASTLSGDAMAAAKTSGKAPQMPELASDSIDRAEAHDLYESAEAHVKKQELDLALRDYDLAIRIAPDQAWLYYGRAQLQQRRHDDDAAAADMKHYLEMEPKDAKAYLQRARVDLRSGDAEHALQDVNKALELDPKMVEGYAQRAAIRLRHKDIAAALPDLDQAIQLDPHSVWALTQRCYAHLQLAQYPPAMDDCNAALAAQPDDIDALLDRGAIQLHAQKYAEAMSDFAAVLKLKPDQPFALYGRGLARKASGDTGGEADLAAARQQDPTVSQMFSEEKP
jgi:tetratricopeptide (TPR) repeat protein